MAFRSSFAKRRCVQPRFESWFTCSIRPLHCSSWRDTPPWTEDVCSLLSCYAPSQLKSAGLFQPSNLTPKNKGTNMPPPVSSKQAGSSAMEITVQKSDLLKELSVTQGIVERKSTIPILTSFLFEATNNNLLITATDLDLSLRTFCSAKVVKAGACTIPARKLYEYLRLLRDGEITIKLMENHWVHIRSGRSNTKMVGMSRDNFPALPLFPAQLAIQLPARVLQTMISKTIFAISHEESP